jgi:hypothetical protein
VPGTQKVELRIALRAESKSAWNGFCLTSSPA